MPAEKWRRGGGQGSPAQLGGFGGPGRPTGSNQPYTGAGGYVNSGIGGNVAQLGQGLYNIGQQASQYAAGIGGAQYGPPESLMTPQAPWDAWQEGTHVMDLGLE